MFKTTHYIVHLIFWGFMYCFIFDYHLMDENWGEAIFYTFRELLTYMIVAYSNYFLLIPFFLKKKKYILYGFSIIGLVLLYIFLIRKSGLENDLYEGTTWRNNFSMILNASLFLLISTLYSYFQQWQKEKERRLLLRSEQLETELKFLKTQISPHFIFNSLNNIYTLALQKHDNAAPMIAQLSKIMRYILYECNEKVVSLEKEIEVVENYIQLQLLRKLKSQNVDFYKEGNLKKYKIAPLLFIHFIENCFKHSDIDQNETAFIKIECHVHEDNLYFFTQNSIKKKTASTKIGGVGSQNIQRQLSLHYPKQHTLSINEENDIFTIELNLELHG